ncbi:MAG: CTP synthase (UTP-ammonia lyase) [Gammaproteobacteria bacterium]|jgi:CTP synthase (UTP-ammonia lyase)
MVRHNELMNIALIGDYQPDVTAHRAIPLALAANADGRVLNHVWIPSNDVDVDALPGFDGIWCVPFSPYQNRLNVMLAIRYAREHNVPCLGTCAGYQHAVLEFARNVLALAEADSVEDNPTCTLPLISSLRCRLYDQSEAINIDPASIVGGLYGQARIAEAYHCGFGVNPEYLSLFEHSAMRFSGFDDAGDPRIFELEGHPFFVGTAFQPERSGLEGKAHPLIGAFIKAMDQVGEK